ncbi:cbh2 [Symbiodinium natans]|uniref:Cbh2 protein n=1 Tax=Symbiodinium natans TaxID=878477 RepID=A0A812SJR7_9DINO|nr:cbh2 [Symbiodinium natans]
MAMKILAWLPVTAFGHSYLASPPSRNFLAHQAGLEDCPHCLQSGGPDNVKARGNGVWPTRLAPGSHGLCGDPVQGKSNPVRLEDETYLKAGAVTATYQAGQVVEFQVAVSTHHQGHYEFRICDTGLDSSLTSEAEGQACLDKWVLQRAPPLADCVVNDPRGDCQPLDPKHPERWYLPPAGSQTQVAGPDFDDSMAPSYPSSGEVHRMRFKIPDGLQCSKCTLQWYWSSGNSCLYDGDYFDYYRGIAALGWDAAAWQTNVLADWATCENSCCRTGGSFGEEFWNCADVQVTAGGGSGPAPTTTEPATTRPASTTTTTTTTAASTTTTTTTTTTTLSSVTSTTASPGVCQKVWGKCGGRNWGGPTCCEEGNICNFQSVWYSQCIPAAALAEMPDLAHEGHDIKKHRRFRGSSFLQDGTLLDQTSADEEL